MIAEELKLDWREDMIFFLESVVGRGSLRASEIYYSIPSAMRREILRAAGEAGLNLSYELDPFARHSLPLRDVRSTYELLTGISECDVFVCLRFGPAERHFGDLYMLLRSYELTLHRLVRQSLEAEYGPGRSGWWKKALPLDVRQTAVKRLELEDDSDIDAWELVTLGELGIVVEKQFKPVFKHLFIPLNTGQLSQQIQSVARIRNSVMHPVKALDLEDDHFEIVLGAWRGLQATANRAETNRAVAVVV